MKSRLSLKEKCARSIGYFSFDFHGAREVILNFMTVLMSPRRNHSATLAAYVDAPLPLCPTIM